MSRDTYYYNNGIYFGQTYNGNRYGIGTYYWKNNKGQYYMERESNFRIVEVDMMVNLITTNVKSGWIYQGEYENNMYHGLGTFQDSNGIYIGQFKNDLKHGRGKIIYKNGDQYQGQWKQGKIFGKGRGVFTFSNGNILVNNIRHGEGLIYGKMVSIIQVIFKMEPKAEQGRRNNDQMKHGKGKLHFDNGDIFQGMFEKNLYHGKGKLTMKNGKIIEGTLNYGFYLDYMD